MTDLTQAIAEIRRVTPLNSPWEAGDIGVGSSPVDYHIATILNAVASGEMIPKADHKLAVAEAYRRAAEAIEAIPRRKEPKGGQTTSYVDLAEATLAIRALTTADQQAALERVKREARAVKPRRGIYVASKAKYGPEWVARREAGMPIVSTWIDQSGVGETSDWPALWAACITEAASAAALVLICRDGDVLKGAWSEVGAALACGVPVFASGTADYSIRHHPNFHQFQTEAEAFEAARIHAAIEGAKP